MMVDKDDDDDDSSISSKKGEDIDERKMNKTGGSIELVQDAITVLKKAKVEEGEGVEEQKQAESQAVKDYRTVENCIRSLKNSLVTCNAEAFLAVLGTIFAVVRTEVMSTDKNMSTLLLSNIDIVSGGAKTFVGDKRIVGAVLDMLWLIKAQMKKKIDVSKHNLFDIMKAALSFHINDINICKQVLRLYGKKSMSMADGSFVKVLIELLKLQFQDECIRQEFMRLLALCIGINKSYFQGLMLSEGGCDVLLDAFVLYARGSHTEDMVNIIVLLADNHDDNRAFFGSTSAMMVYLTTLIPNIGNEIEFNLASLPIFYSLIQFSDPETRVLDDCTYEPIKAVLEYTKNILDEDLKTETSEYCLRFIRELCTIQSSLKLLQRNGFSVHISQFIEPQSSRKARKLCKSIIKLLDTTDNIAL
jgi:hypothetical protein